MDFGVINETDGNNIVTLDRTNGFFNRDSALASGTQGVTGVGFQPTDIFFVAITDGGVGASWGFYNALSDNLVRDQHALSAGQYGSGSESIQVRQTAANVYTGIVQSLDVDGFTISWTRQSTPTGNLRIHYMAFK